MDQVDVTEQLAVTNLIDGAASLTPAWFLLRRLGLSASCMATYCGLSKYSSPWHMWWHMRYTPHESMEPTDATRHGQRYEDHCIAGFEQWSGNAVSNCPFRVSDMYRWIRTTPDGLVMEDVLQRPPAPATVECKCPYNAMYDTPPLQYVVQVMDQLFTYRIRVGYLAVWHPSGAMRVWRILWSPVYWHWIMERAAFFWCALQMDVAPCQNTLPWVVAPAEELMKQQMHRRLDEAQYLHERVHVAHQYRLHPEALPPYAPIECLRFDAVDETACNYLKRGAPIVQYAHRGI